MKLTITIDTKEVLNKPIDEWDEEDMDTLDEEKKNLPAKEVKLSKEEAMVDPGENAKPVIHIVKKGETLKEIAARYGVSYGELSNHLMNTEGNTSIHEGQEIKIPRHFIDLTEAK
jgi:hypothetical protein